MSSRVLKNPVCGQNCRSSSFGIRAIFALFALFHHPARIVRTSRVACSWSNRYSVNRISRRRTLLISNSSCVWEPITLSVPITTWCRVLRGERVQSIDIPGLLSYTAVDRLTFRTTTVQEEFRFSDVSRCSDQRPRGHCTGHR